MDRKQKSQQILMNLQKSSRITHTLFSTAKSASLHTSCLSKNSNSWQRLYTTWSVLKVEAASPEAFTVCVCVCEIVLSGQRQIASGTIRGPHKGTKKKEIKPTFSPQHNYSTIPNKHRKMLNHNFYCSVIRRQFKGNIATYILGEPSQGLQNYFQYLKEKREMLITQKLDTPEWEDGCKCSRAKCQKNKRWKTQQKVSPCVTTECGANLVETSGTGLNFTRPKAQLSVITHTQKKCDIYLVSVYWFTQKSLILNKYATKGEWI